MYDPYRNMLQKEALQQTQARLESIVSEATRAKVNAVADTAFIFTADYFLGEIVITVPDGAGTKTYIFEAYGHDSWRLEERSEDDPYPEIKDADLEAKMLELWSRHNAQAEG